MRALTVLFLFTLLLSPALAQEPTESGKWLPVNNSGNAYVEMYGETRIGVDLDKGYSGFDYYAAGARLDWDIVTNRSAYGIGVQDGRRGEGIRGEIVVDDFGINHGDGWSGSNIQTKVGTIYARLYVYGLFFEISRNADFSNQDLESLPANVRAGYINGLSPSYYKRPNDSTFIGYNVVKRSLWWYGQASETDAEEHDAKNMVGIRIGYRDSKNFELVGHIASAGNFNRNDQNNLNTNFGYGVRLIFEHWGIENLTLRANVMTGIGNKTFMSYNEYNVANKPADTNPSGVVDYYNRDSHKTDYHNGAVSASFSSAYNIPLTGKYSLQAVGGVDSVFDYVVKNEEKIEVAVGGGLRFRWPGPWNWDDSEASVGYAFGRPSNGGNRFSGLSFGMNFVYRDYKYPTNEGANFTIDPGTGDIAYIAAATTMHHGTDKAVNLNISSFENRTGGLIPGLGWLLSYEVKDLFNAASDAKAAHALSAQFSYGIFVGRLGRQNLRGEWIPYWGLYFAQPTSVRTLKDVQVTASAGVRALSVIPNTEFQLHWQSGMLTSASLSEDEKTLYADAAYKGARRYNQDTWGKFGSLSLWLKVFY